MYRKFNRCIRGLICAVLSVFIILCTTGCGKKDTVSGNTDIIQAGESGSDQLDPENTDLNNGMGATVKADDLYHQNGKANGIDVSKWQGKINWNSVKKSGIDFAIIRIGYRGENGTIYKDSYADYNIQQAEKAGVLIGVYFFSTAINETEATEEAKWTVNAISGYPISYPVVYDCEGFMSADSRMHSVTNAQRTLNCEAFFKYIENNGYEGMLYAAKSELEASAYWDTLKIEASYKIWVARYTDVPYPTTPNPDYNGKYDMWQYTNMGKVSGVDGNVDMIVSYFTKEKATAKNPSASSGTAVAPTQSDSIYSPVSDSVTAKEITNLREQPSTKSNIVASIKNGESVDRTGIGSNGWSKLVYNGKTVYAITSYLTTDKNYVSPSSAVSSSQITSSADEFTSASGQVTAKEETNLRSAPSTDSEIVATIKNGEFHDKTGESSKGWTRIDYNGRTVYAKTNLLTTEVNKTSSEVSSSQVSSTNGPQFTEVNEQVTAKSETNLRAEPSGKDGVAIIYTLKNGETVTRTGISTNGWSRLIYNGQTVYAVTSYLTK